MNMLVEFTYYSDQLQKYFKNVLCYVKNLKSNQEIMNRAGNHMKGHLK